MQRIYRYKKWVDWAAFDAATVLDLYNAVAEVTSNDLFTCEELDANRYLVYSTTRNIESALVLKKDQVKNFLKYLEDTHGDGDVESNYLFEYAMANSD